MTPQVCKKASTSTNAVLAPPRIRRWYTSVYTFSDAIPSVSLPANLRNITKMNFGLVFDFRTVFVITFFKWPKMGPPKFVGSCSIEQSEHS